MERQIRRIAAGFLLLFLALAVNVNYVQVIAAEDLRNNPHNKRLLIEEYDVRRGQIIAANRETVLAESKPTQGQLKYLRRYPNGQLYAHITGYYSFVFGRSELEQSFNDELAGRSAELLPQRLVDELLGRDRRGAGLVLSIVPRLQRIASRGLGEREGAVAAIDPQTGEVLALVARPTFDPNRLSSHDGKKIRAAWDELNADKDKPLVSNASDEYFPPGSTFKIVVAAAALENGMTPEDNLPNPPELDLPQTNETLENFGGGQCPGGSQISLAQALEVSCNVAFGALGLDLGAERLSEQARRFGFGRDIPFHIPFQEGTFPEPEHFADNQPLVALSAIGQADVNANALHMALVAGAIGNDGVMMEPRLVTEVRDPSGRVARRLEPAVYGEAMSPQSARRLARMMQAVVESGTGTAAQIDGVSVGGKTGTAQQPGGDPHAWFVSFAPVEDPTIAVAVVVLNGGDAGSEATGGEVAAPIARDVMAAALRG
ncbi:MAG TPA: penicillin-binding protein 2 [Actinomycetota bacterium]|nr:penicillin-binding protein 2 [Actinomycetota bacterium]